MTQFIIYSQLISNRLLWMSAFFVPTVRSFYMGTLIVPCIKMNLPLEFFLWAVTCHMVKWAIQLDIVQQCFMKNVGLLC